MTRFSLPSFLIAAAALLALAISGSLNTVSAQLKEDPNPKFPYVGEFKAIDRGLWKQWNFSRPTLGKATSREYEFNHMSGTKVAVMHFERGLIARHITGAKAGQIFVVRYQFYKMWGNHDGMGGRLGLPISGVFNFKGGKAQSFQGGFIYLDTRTNEYVVDFN